MNRWTTTNAARCVNPVDTGCARLGICFEFTDWHPLC